LQGKGKPKGLPKWTKDLKEMEKEIDQVLSKDGIASNGVFVPTEMAPFPCSLHGAMWWTSKEGHLHPSKTGF